MPFTACHTHHQPHPHTNPYTHTTNPPTAPTAGRPARHAHETGNAHNTPQRNQHAPPNQPTHTNTQTNQTNKQENDRNKQNKTTHDHPDHHTTNPRSQEPRVTAQRRASRSRLDARVHYPDLKQQPHTTPPTPQEIPPQACTG